MTLLRKLLFRLFELLHKKRLETDMDDEMRSHLEMQSRENIEAGMEPEAACRAALLEFGWVESIKETCRDQRGGRWMDDFFQDLRFGARALLRNPGFAAVSVVTLALGIGADTAIFSAVNALILQPLPYKDSGQIAQLLQTDKRTGKQSVEVSPADFIDLESQVQAFEAISGWQPVVDFVDEFNPVPPSGTSVLENGTTERKNAFGPAAVKGVAVSGNLFTLLGVQPYLGRALFLPEETNEKVVILSYRLWRGRFGADFGLIGRTLRFSDSAYAVVGVLAPDFTFPTEPPAQWQPDLFVPLRLPKGGGYRSSSSLHVLGRLKVGRSLEQAQAEVSAVAARLAKEYPETNSKRGIRALRLRDLLVGQARPALLILFGAVSFVLLIACVNVTNLLLVRASARAREIAIRSVLGAGRTRLLRLFLTESLLLAVLGGIGALLMASWVLKILLAMLPENFPRIVPIHIDTRVLGFSLGIAVLAALILGTVPALQSSRFNLSQSLKGDRSLFAGVSRHRFRSWLVIAEISLASMLLIGAGLMAKSYWVVTHSNLGFNPQQVMAVATWPPGSGNARRNAYYGELFQRVRRLPGVQGVALVDSLPLLGTDAASTISIAGHRSENHGMVGQRSISEDYFHVLQIPLIRGRNFSEQDTETSEKVVVINQALVRHYFGQEDPIGQTIIIFERVRVVGVVGDVKPNGFESLVVPEMYFPFRQWNTFGLRLLVRTSGRPRALASSIRAEISAMEPRQVVETIRSLDQILSTQVAPRRFNAVLLGCFALVGLAIAAIGIYGVMSYSVSQRTHEIGIRMALGAKRGEVLNMVLRQGVLLALTGIGFGLAGAWALTRLLSNLLYEVKPTDATTYVAISFCLVGVAVLACLLPVLRAIRVDPMTALRYE